MNKKLFDVVHPYATVGVHALLDDNKFTVEELNALVKRHEINEDDNEYAKDRALNNSEYCFSVYFLHGIKLYIITENYEDITTTILLPEEY